MGWDWIGCDEMRPKLLRFIYSSCHVVLYHVASSQILDGVESAISIHGLMLLPGAFCAFIILSVSFLISGPLSYLASHIEHLRNVL